MFSKRMSIYLILIVFFAFSVSILSSCWPKQKVLDTSVPMVDLTQTLSAKIPRLKDQHRFALHKIYDSSNYYANWFEASDQSGTHISAPEQYARNTFTIDRIVPQDLIGPAIVIDVTLKCRRNPDYMLSKKDIEAWEDENGKVPSGAIVIMYTGWQAKWETPSVYLNKGKDGFLHYPNFSVDAAQFLIRERDIKAIGIDTIGVDPGQSSIFPVHIIMHKSGKYLIENLTNLDRLPTTGAVIIALPIKIEKGGAAPARVIALLPE